MNSYTLPFSEAKRLLAFYKENKRDLPWRKSKSPYGIWVSEIMLQQTRIDTVIPYYLTFMKAYPTIQSLANAKDDDLIKLWEGLGYYSRVKNLKKSAQIVTKDFQGKLPNTYEELIQLPGIGAYTAGAILSLAYNQMIPAVDGNVVRVLSRYFGIQDKFSRDEFIHLIKEILQSFFDTNQKRILQEDDFMSNFNQGLMEVGALVCIPNGAPKCKQCPFNKKCVAYQNQCIDTIPYIEPKKERKIIKRTILLIQDKDHFYIQKRPSEGLLADFYEFVGIESHCTKEEAVNTVEEFGFKVRQIEKLPSYKHIFTHLEWHMDAYDVIIDKPKKVPTGLLCVNKKQMNQYAFPSAFHTYLEFYGILD